MCSVRDNYSVKHKAKHEASNLNQYKSVHVAFTLQRLLFYIVNKIEVQQLSLGRVNQKHPSS